MENLPIEFNRDKSNIPPFSLSETNRIQMDLILKSHSQPEEWIEKNAHKFREIIESKPEFADQYRKNPDEFEKFMIERLEEGKGETMH